MQRRLFFAHVLSLGCSAVSFNAEGKERFDTNSEKGLLSATYIAAAKNAAGLYSVGYFDLTGTIGWSLDIPFRGHGFASHRHGVTAVVGRRPASQFMLIYPEKQTEITRLPSDRHLYGHGVFHPNGRTLYLTENNLHTGQGVIGIYNTANAKRLGEWPSYGIGPHAIAFDEFKQRLVVANGGLKTHPRTGRKKLNLDTMQPSLAFIDPLSGNLIQQRRLAEQYRYNSIRHLALNSRGSVYVALQNQKAQTPQVLVAIYNIDSDEFTPCTMPPEIEATLGGYIGDICLDRSQQYFAASSPRGNRVLFFSSNGQFVAAADLVDACGLASTSQSNEFIVTSGTGKVRRVLVGVDRKLAITESLEDGRLHWDNHMISLS